MHTNSGKIWVGKIKGGKYEIFRSVTTPTEESHGHKYVLAIGPFRTMRGAIFMRDHGGQNNPHLQSVANAEALAKKYAHQK